MTTVISPNAEVMWWILRPVQMCTSVIRGFNFFTNICFLSSDNKPSVKSDRLVKKNVERKVDICAVRSALLTFKRDDREG